jgi:hypothetical protein
MSAIIASRMSSPALKLASASLPASSRSASTTSGPYCAITGADLGFWKKWSPTTRRNVKIGVAICLATDAFVLYNYPGVFGLKAE